MILEAVVVHLVLNAHLTSLLSAGNPPRVYVPRYDETDTFVIAGDAKPEGLLILDQAERNSARYDGYDVQQFSPRCVGQQARIERWSKRSSSLDKRWRRTLDCDVEANTFYSEVFSEHSQHSAFSLMTSCRSRYELDVPSVRGNDIFSSRRSGLEIKQTRSCAGTPMMHHFGELSFEKKPLIRSIEFSYDKNLQLE